MYERQPDFVYERKLTLSVLITPEENTVWLS